MAFRRVIRAAAGLLAFVALGVSVATASAGDGHLPGFGSLDRRVAVSKLPPPIGFAFGEIPGLKGRIKFGPKVRGPVWFGQVERPAGTVDAAGTRRKVCVAEELETGAGPSSVCAPLGAARELDLLHVGSCGKGPPRHFRIYALVPDGVTGIAIEREDGAVGRTVPAIGNTVAFTVGRENIRLRGVGDPGAKRLERRLPLASAAKEVPRGGAGCTFYDFLRTGPRNEAIG